MSTAPAPGTTATGLDLDGTAWVATELDEVALESSSLRHLRATGGTWIRSAFVDCTLDGSDLAGLVTTDCSLVRCTLDGARLTGSQWLRSRWREVRAADLAADGVAAHSSTWTEVTIADSRLAELDLSDATLERVHFTGCDLSRARFAGARCTAVTFTGCTLDGVTGVTGLRGADVGHSDGVSMLPALARELGIRVVDDVT